MPRSSLVVNPASGVGDGDEPITMDEINEVLRTSSAAVLALLDELVHTRATFPDPDESGPRMTRVRIENATYLVTVDATDQVLRNATDPHRGRPHHADHRTKRASRTERWAGGRSRRSAQSGAARRCGRWLGLAGARPSPRSGRGCGWSAAARASAGADGEPIAPRDGRGAEGDAQTSRHRRPRQARDAGPGQPPHPPPHDPPARSRRERRPPGLPHPGVGGRGRGHGPRDRRAGRHARRPGVAARRLHHPARHVLPPRGHPPRGGGGRQPPRHRPGVLRRPRARRPRLGRAPRRPARLARLCSTRSAAPGCRSRPCRTPPTRAPPTGFAEVVGDPARGSWPPATARACSRRTSPRTPPRTTASASGTPRRPPSCSPAPAGSSPTCPSSSATACTSAAATASPRRRGAPPSPTAPGSNLKLASGALPWEAVRDSGIRLGIGTDGCSSSNDLDMWQAMRQAALLARLTSGRPDVASATEVLRAATIEGARALGLGDEIGSVEVGKRADLVLLDLAAPHLTPVHDVAALLVFAAGRGDVTDVLVDGEVVVRDRRSTRLDTADLLARAHRPRRGRPTRRRGGHRDDRDGRAGHQAPPDAAHPRGGRLDRRGTPHPGPERGHRAAHQPARRVLGDAPPRRSTRAGSGSPVPRRRCCACARAGRACSTTSARRRASSSCAAARGWARRPSGDWTLLSCWCSPAFRPEHFELGAARGPRASATPATPPRSPR